MNNHMNQVSKLETWTTRFKGNKIGIYFQASTT